MSSTSASASTREQEVVGAEARRLPSVTIVVPTYNRSGLLPDTLSCLTAQAYPPDRLEIIVVDNSSTDNTEQVVREAQAWSPFPLHYYRKENRGPAASRNFGLERATGEIVGFTDSDCRMAPDWVANAVRRMGEQVSLVAGPIRPIVNPERPPGFFLHQVDEIDCENGLYPTANIFYRREVFDQVGGFDEQFGAYAWGPPVGGEDVELAWRAKRAGHRSAFAEDAPIYHEASKLPIGTWLLEPLRVRIVPRMVHKIPELRERFLWRRYFLNRYHPIFYAWVVGMGLAVASRRPWPLALTVPWFWIWHTWVHRDLWPPTRWWRIPLKYGLITQARGLFVGTLACSSLRHRTLVL